MSTNESQINECIRSIADQVVKSATVENEPLSINVVTNEVYRDPEAIVVTVNENIYQNNLPPNITMEQIQTIKQYNSDFTAGVLLGTGLVALEKMKTTPEVKFVTGFVHREDRNTFVSAYAGIHADDSGAPNDLELFSFGAQVKTKGEFPVVDLMKVRYHLKELYIEALCEPKSIKVKDES